MSSHAFSSKSAIFGSVGTIVAGFFAYLAFKRWKSDEDEIMEVIFTNDRSEEERTRNVRYLDVAQLNFAPRNLLRIEAYIDSAKKTIDAAVYLFNVQQLGAAIIRAYERGVTVRVVGCNSMRGATGTQFGVLQQRGIPVLFKITSMCMHHKFCLIDARDQTENEKQSALNRVEKLKQQKLKKTRSITQKNDVEKSEKEINETERQHTNLVHIPSGGICITGSCNWTMQGFASNWENILITSHKKVVESFRREFERIWNDFLGARNNIQNHI